MTNISFNTLELDISNADLPGQGGRWWRRSEDEDNRYPAILSNEKLIVAGRYNLQDPTNLVFSKITEFDLITGLSAEHRLNLTTGVDAISTIVGLDNDEYIVSGFTSAPVGSNPSGSDNGFVARLDSNYNILWLSGYSPTNEAEFPIETVVNEDIAITLYKSRIADQSLLAAYDIDDGSLIWDYEFDSSDTKQVRPQHLVDSGNYVYVSSKVVKPGSSVSNEITKIDLATGLPKSSISLNSISTISNISVSSSQLLVAGQGKDFYIIDSDLAKVEAYESELDYGSYSLRDADSFVIGEETPAFGSHNYGGGAATYQFVWVDDRGFQNYSIKLDESIPSGFERVKLSNSNKALILQPQQLLVLELEDSATQNTPYGLTISASKFDENIPSNSAVATLSSSDQDVGDSFTYSLVSGDGDTDNNAFLIDGDKLTIKASPDYETKDSYSIRLKTTDSGGLTFEKEVAISVTDINEAPTQLTYQQLV